MIIKLNKVISCSSEHPNFPASNLLHNPPPGPWKCAKPGEMLATVILELSEPSCIIGLDIGNYRSCIIIVEASKSTEPDHWTQIINHQFLTHDEAANNKFKDQVQLFTKKELNSDILKEKFDRVKVTCMQSANLKELFGLAFITLRTEVVIDLGINVFGRFKMKAEEPEKARLSFKEKYLNLFPEKQKSYKEELAEKIKETTVNNFNKRQEEERQPRKRPLLEKLEAGKSEEVFGKKPNEDTSEAGTSTSSIRKPNGVTRTPFGDIISTPERQKNPPSKQQNIVTKTETKMQLNDKKNVKEDDDKKQKKPRRRLKIIDDDDEDDTEDEKCTCSKNSPDEKCKVCKRLPTPTAEKLLPRKKTKIDPPKNTAKKEFSKLMEDVTFALSGYVNPQREEIRRKALKMGAKYVADPNTTNNKCTHLICAFKNTPKSQQLKGHSKIVSHIYIEECFDHKKRFPWRRYALNSSDKKQPESEEEIDGSASPPPPVNPYEVETESESNDGDY
ncbi:DNA repair protein XRCC1 [Chelonus insularis]|uniref:DNA repair protein XRCC1 n=1 Tax=Chelonus insularis TaxID=460826 RepID=UPI0015897C1C|nr:DNA repair protein XRCC1 [Chelonus insularis]